ncbi:MAG: ParB N-terminal domain-containing protein [Planctomycetia bacterium]|nr:ParB N-terminal domain-containing protein [Planctomycetia bacterium]
MCTFAIEPAPENDTLYDPIREDDPAFLAFAEDIQKNRIINPLGVSVDGYIYDGHRRYAAARYLGMSYVPIRIDPKISRLKDPDGFLRRLKSCNEQRVKTAAEVMRESLVTMEPDTWQRVCDYRESVSNVDGAEVFRLIGAKKRSQIVQKRSLADAIIRTVNDYYAEYGPTSDRKIFYLLLNIPGLLRNDARKTPFGNSQECYDDVTDLLTRLRLDGSSLPPRKGMVDRFRESGREKLILIVDSDFDPEGQDIPNSFGLSLRDDFDIEPDRLVIIKAALTYQQTQQLDLHEGQIAKEDSARYGRFVDAYGERCWELEAVPTDTHRDIAEATIRRVIDLDRFNEELARQKQEQADLNEHRRRVREALAKIRWDEEGLG